MDILFKKKKLLKSELRRVVLIVKAAILCSGGSDLIFFCFQFFRVSEEARDYGGRKACEMLIEINEK